MWHAGCCAGNVLLNSTSGELLCIGNGEILGVQTLSRLRW